MIILLLLLKLSVSHSQQCVDTVHLKLDPVTTAEYIDVKVLVKGFKDLVSFQYALNYDADILKFDKVLSNLPEFNVGNFFDDKKGKVRLLWTKLLSTVGTTLPENAVLMTLRFQKIKFGGVSSISLSDGWWNLKKAHYNIIRSLMHRVTTLPIYQKEHIG